MTQPKSVASKAPELAIIWTFDGVYLCEVEKEDCTWLYARPIGSRTDATDRQGGSKAADRFAKVPEVILRRNASPGEYDAYCALITRQNEETAELQKQQSELERRHAEERREFFAEGRSET